MGISRIFCEAQEFPVSHSDGVRNHADNLLNDINNQDYMIYNRSSFSFFSFSLASSLHFLYSHSSPVILRSQYNFSPGTEWVNHFSSGFSDSLVSVL